MAESSEGGVVLRVPEMSSSANTLKRENSNDCAQGIKRKNSIDEDRQSQPKPSFNEEEVAASSDPSPTCFTVDSPHSVPSEPAFSFNELGARPRAKSVPTIIEQQVALFLRTISDEMNSSYSMSSRSALDRIRRASYPGNIHLQETMSPLSPTNFQWGSSSGSASGGTVSTGQRIGRGAHRLSSSMDSVPEEESDSGDEV